MKITDWIIAILIVAVLLALNSCMQKEQDRADKEYRAKLVSAKLAKMEAHYNKTLLAGIK